MTLRKRETFNHALQHLLYTLNCTLAHAAADNLHTHYFCCWICRSQQQIGEVKSRHCLAQNTINHPSIVSSHSRALYISKEKPTNAQIGAQHSPWQQLSAEQECRPSICSTGPQHPAKSLKRGTNVIPSDRNKPARNH